MQRAVADLRTTLRKLLQSPGFTLVSLLTLAIGIGANSAIFSIVNAVMLEPLPFPGSDRLVGVLHTAPGLDLESMPQSEVTFLLYRDHSRGLESIALFNDDRFTLTGGQTPEQVPGALVTGQIFDVLGTRQLDGRLLQPEDLRPGGPLVVLVSERFVERRYGGDRSVIGRSLQLGGEPHEIIGILPAGFAFPNPETELWLPMRIDEERAQLGSFNAFGIGRLRPDTTPAELELELDNLLANIDEIFPGQSATRVLQNAGFSAVVRPYRDVVVGDIGAVLWLLLGSVGFVLLIACANVANLFLVRAEGRQREVAIRTALGASRGSLVRAFLTESVLLGLLGGALGLLLALGGLRLLLQLEPGNIPRLHEIDLDGTVLLFTFLLSLLAGALFGLFPALRSASPKLALSLKEGGRSSVGRERHRARNLLVASQVCLAFVLLVGCGLMVRSFARLSAVDPGLRAENVLSFRLFLPAADYAEDLDVATAHQEILDRLASLPGVVSAAAISEPPLQGTGSGSGHEIEDHPLAEDEPPRLIYFRQATEDYFATLGIPVLAGRAFTRADHEQRSRVAIVNQTVAEHYWPGKTAIGRRLSPGRADEEGEENWFTIVGVVGNVRNAGLHEPPPEMVYYPILGPDERNGPRGMSYVVRTEGSPSSLAAGLRSEIWSFDDDLPIAGLEPLARAVDRTKARWSFTLLLLAVAAAVALLLGSIGIYGVVSYIVAQRTSELGIRMALGANRGDVSRMVLRQGLTLALVGFVPGLLVAVVLTRWMRAVLFEVSPFDPLTFGLVPLALIVVACLASLMPAYRASRVSPVEALKHE